MFTSSPSHPLQLHQVPAGRRLDFTGVPGCFAYVYRRQGQQPWQCVARNACSPYLDRNPPVATTAVEYVVCFCDANGRVTAATPIVSAPPVALAVSAAGRLVAC